MKDRGFSVLLPTAGMEVCRLCAVFSLVFLIPGSLPFPFAAMSLIFLTGMFLGKGLSSVRRRAIADVLLYGGGGIAAVYAALGKLPLGGISGLAEWGAALSSCVFWFQGIRTGSKKISHELTVNRYDAGLALLFFVYFLRRGLEAEDSFGGHFIGGYFLFAILALFAAKNKSGDKNFINVKPAASFLVPFLACFSLSSFALILLYPLLALSAEKAWVVLREGARPLSGFLVAALRFLFGFQRRTDAAETSLQGAGDSFSAAVEPVSSSGIFVKILMGGIAVLLAAAGLVLALWLARRLAAWLLSRKGTENAEEGLFAALARLARNLHGLFSAIWEKIKTLGRKMRRQRKRPEGAGTAAFFRLCVWGRRLGLPRRPAETPSEYGRRLSLFFPLPGEEILFLVREAEREIYGEEKLCAETASCLKKITARFYSLRIFLRLIISRLIRAGG